jgi:ABC-2 type transport system permease protein
MPITYWLELLRRSLMGSAPEIETFPRLTDLDLLGILVSLTLLLSATALVIFRSCDNLARERGLIDRTSGH